MCMYVFGIKAGCLIIYLIIYINIIYYFIFYLIYYSIHFFNPVLLAVVGHADYHHSENIWSALQA